MVSILWAGVNEYVAVAKSLGFCKESESAAEDVKPVEKVKHGKVIDFKKKSDD